MFVALLAVTLDILLGGGLPQMPAVLLLFVTVIVGTAVAV